MCFNCLLVTHFCINLHSLHNQIYNHYTVNVFNLSLSYCMVPCPVQLVVVKLPDLSVVCSVGPSVCLLEDTPQPNWLSQKGMTGIIMPFCSSLVYLKSGCWVDAPGRIPELLVQELFNAPGRSSRALGFLKLFPQVLGVLRHIRFWPTETHLGQNLQYLINPALITYNFPPTMDKSWNMFLLSGVDEWVQKYSVSLQSSLSLPASANKNTLTSLQILI